MQNHRPRIKYIFEMYSIVRDKILIFILVIISTALRFQSFHFFIRTKKASSILNSFSMANIYRKCGTHAQVLSRRLAEGNSKNETRNGNRGRRQEKRHGDKLKRENTAKKFIDGWSVISFSSTLVQPSVECVTVVSYSN